MLRNLVTILMLERSITLRAFGPVAPTSCDIRQLCEQRSEIAFVCAPESDRAGIERSPDLRGARRTYCSFCEMKLQTSAVPWQIAVGQDATNFVLQVPHQMLIIDVKDT